MPGLRTARKSSGESPLQVCGHAPAGALSWLSLSLHLWEMGIMAPVLQGCGETREARRTAEQGTGNTVGARPVVPSGHCGESGVTASGQAVCQHAP